MLSALRKRLFFSGAGEPRPIGGEGPRGYVGGLWHEMGEMQFRFLVEHGLRPEHVFLDIACGSLRLGVRAIPYLNPDNYLGIDLKGDLIEHGKTIEVGPIMCQIKRPEFVISDDFEFWRFSKAPDFAMAQSLFSHLIADDIRLCLRNLAKHRKQTTVFYATFFEADGPTVNPPISHPHDVFKFTQSEMAEFGSQTGWAMDYIGDWGHPRNQKMLKYAVA